MDVRWPRSFRPGATGKRKFLGDMIGTAEIIGDIVSPVIDS
jgi:hypothetical protein